MSGDLRPYKAELQSAGARLRGVLADSAASVTAVALARATFDRMDDQLLRWPDAVVHTYDRRTDRLTGASREKLWRLDAETFSRTEILPLENPDVAARHRQLQEDYLRKGMELVQLPSQGPTALYDRVDGIVYLIRPNPVLLQKVTKVVADQLMRWFAQHRITKEFLAQPAKTGYYEFLLNRPDMQALLRIIDEHPVDVTAIVDPSLITKKTQTAAQALVELAILIIPVVGQMVISYELWEGKDLFGNKLSTVDRAILSAAVMLPMLGMMVKGGRAAYTETRLVRIYGGTEKEWQRVITAVGRLEAGDARILAEAEHALRVAGKLEPNLPRRAAAALPGMAKLAGLLQSSVDKVVSEAYAVLSKRHAIVQTLDDFAILRVLEKGPHPDLIKGQLLEEVIQSRLVAWLANPNGYIALGLRSPIPRGSKVIFVPGHMITDTHGRQLTDGILATWEKNELVIHVVFEAKAGRSAARELRVGKGGISSLSATDRAVLRAESARVHRTLKRRVELEGTKFTRTVDDVEKEVLADIRFSEQGGQIRRDVERLYQDAEGRAARIYVGDLPTAVPVRISPTRTKFMGVLPADVDPTTIEATVRGLGYNFEVIRAAIASRELTAISTELTPLADRMATALLQPLL